MLDVRVGVEWMGAQLAARNARADELDEMAALVEAAKRAREPERVGTLGREFHALVAEASHNRVLVATLTSIREALHTHRPGAPPEPKRVLAIHTALLEALRQRDAQRAGELMLEDVQRQRDWWHRRERRPPE